MSLCSNGGNNGASEQTRRKLPGVNKKFPVHQVEELF